MIAVIQLLVMVMLAVPACCYDSVADQGCADSSITAYASDTGPDNSKDECPCCPDEEQSEGDGCSTCNNCTFYTLTVSSASASYLPSLARLEVFVPFTKLTEVHIPIFVPPQNLA